MGKLIQIECRVEEITRASLAVDEQLHQAGVNDEDRVRTLLMLEEVLVKIIEQADPTAILSIRLRRSLHKRTLEISFRGQQVSLHDMIGVEGLDLSDGLLAPEAEEHIREIILQGQSDHLNASYRNGINRISLGVTQSKKATLVNTLLGIILGLVTGLIIRATCSTELAAQLAEYIFEPMYDIFLTAIKMLMAPLVFFSMVSSLIGLSDMRSLERMGGKLMGLYFTTALIGIALTIAFMHLLSPGTFGSMAGVFDNAETAENIDVSPLHTILHIVPDSFVAPFVHTDMLQVLFLAICFGITASLLGKSSQPIISIVESLNDLFSKMMSLIAKVIPFAVFGSMAEMAISMDGESTLSVLSLAAVIILCIILMIGVYALLLLFAGLKPLSVFRAHADAVITAASSFSASAAMPVAMRCCRETGISPRIYSFSIPFGSSINMDGQAIYYTATVLFLANICGVEIGLGTLITLSATILLMGMATPSAPGAALACQTMLLSMVGVPSGALVMVLVLESLMDPLIIAMETISDATITTIVAKSEGEIRT